MAASACGLSLGKQSDPLSDFVDAFNDRDAAAAAALTDDPDAARQAMAATFTGMGRSVPDLSTIESLSGKLTTHIAWTLPSGGKAETTGAIEDLVDGKVPWSPGIIDSRMKPGGRLVYTQRLDYSSPVVGRKRNPIMEWTAVTAVEIAADAPAEDVSALVDALEPIDAGVTDASVRQAMAEAADDAEGSDRDGAHDGAGAHGEAGHVDGDDAAGDPGSGYATVIELRDEDAAPLRDTLDAIPSVALTEQGRLLTVDPGLHSPALADMPDLWRSVLAKTAGWSVELDNPGADDVNVKTHPPDDVQNVPITLDASTQKAAQLAVAGVDSAAAIVALDPSDGGVLAVAQNEAADDRGPVALSGLYSPGEVFGVVTTAAAIGAGDVAPDDDVDCPATVTLDGVTVGNDDGFALEPGPLSAAFAAPCSTTQARLAAGLGDEDLRTTALSLGLGVDFATPGLTSATGSVPPADSTAARISAGIGQGDVAVSPFGLAVVAASLANKGAMITPTLLAGRAPEGAGDGSGSADTRPTRAPGTPDDDSASAGVPGAEDPGSAPHTVSKDTAGKILSMMRGAVKDGPDDDAAAGMDLRPLGDIDGVGDLAAKAGDSATADRPGHGWVVGVADGMAFVVFVQNAGSAQPAVDTAGAFLTAVGAG